MLIEIKFIIILKTEVFNTYFGIKQTIQIYD